MSVPQNTKTCPACAGSGCVPRVVSPLADDEHVRRYLQGMPYYGQEVCSACGGSGCVPLKPEDVKENP